MDGGSCEVESAPTPIPMGLNLMEFGLNNLYTHKSV